MSRLQSCWETLWAYVLSETNLIIVSSASMLMLAASLILVPWFVVQLPADRFITRRTRLRDRIRQGQYARFAARIGKNVLGIIVLIAGILMLVLPGQGLLTILVAALLLDFPAKHQVERGLIRVKGVKPSADWLRRKYGREPFRL